MHPFTKDKLIFRKGVEFRVQRVMSEDEVQLENVNTGEITTHKVFNLTTEYVQYDLKTVEDVAQERETGVVRRPPARMDHMSASARANTRRKLAYLVGLDNKGSFAQSKATVITDIAEVAAGMGDPRPPHYSTVNRWRRKYLQARSDVRALFDESSKRGAKGRVRLAPEVEAVLHQKIEEVFLSKKRSSAEEVYNAIFLEIQHLNTLRIESEWLKVPGLRTVQRRLAGLYAFDVAVARVGMREATRRFANNLGARRVSRILELVEIDHTPVDLLVCNDEGVVLGRPMMTAILDRHSRCLLGYHLSLAGYGVSAVFAALMHALMPKLYLKERYADLNLSWDCYGWFDRILMDNGAEFHAGAIGDALMNIGIIGEFARSRTPNDKPHIERFFRTFNYSFIHRLPGTTLARVGDRIGYKAEDEAAITLEQLDILIHRWVCNVYHLRPHGGLDGRAPISVWNESAQAFPPQLKRNKSDLDIEFCQVATSALQHYGIDLNCSVFVSPALLTLRRMLPKGTNVSVKWPEWDQGHIFVWNPIDEVYFKVPNKEQDFKGLTLEQTQAVRKARSSGDPSFVATRATAEDMNREMVESAMNAKKLKDRRLGARLANKNSAGARGTGGPPLTEQDVDVVANIPAVPKKAAAHLIEDYDIDPPVDLAS